MSTQRRFFVKKINKKKPCISNYNSKTDIQTNPIKPNCIATTKLNPILDTKISRAQRKFDFPYNPHTAITSIA